MSTVSVLTCVLGEPPELDRTFQSLRTHLSPTLRWVIKATEATGEQFLRRYEHAYVATHRRADRGLYDGMNQGLELLESDYYFVLGAGDQVISPGVQKLQTLLAGRETPAAIFLALYHEAHRSLLVPAPLQLGDRMACPHPSAVLRVKPSRDVGGFDERYLIAADYDHLCRYVRSYGHGVAFNDPLVSYMGGGLSERRALEGMLEEELVRLRVWNSNDMLANARLLARGTNYAVTILHQVAQAVQRARPQGGS